ncbi:LysR family transcriptional regulator [Cobetia sp. QF-1]|uniref:LysR family transcriptional regulator n=1 Tax=Cobetia sp. QF-1 TaxID=1969833 RepID=UPI0020CEA975|nr:LysR family transcriptional regulator [Cobetia sp. QF-1]
MAHKTLPISDDSPLTASSGRDLNLPMLPPLNALRAFDAAARFESASRAAEALHVTHGAVSRQIRQLEETLGTQLFERVGRGLRLTQAGHELATATRHHLGGLARVCSELTRRDARAPFVLSCPGSFLARWCIPRLGALKQSLPELELHLTASDEADTLRPGIDGVLRFQMPPFKETERQETRVLGKERIGPVLRPDAAWLPNETPPSPAVLLDLPLLHTRSRSQAWPDWCARQSLPSDQLHYAQGFEHLNYLLEATLVGLGVGIAPDYLVEEDLRSKRLIAPWGFVETQACLTLTLPEAGRARGRHPYADVLSAWLAQELAAAPHAGQ